LTNEVTKNASNLDSNNTAAYLLQFYCPMFYYLSL